MIKEQRYFGHIPFDGLYKPMCELMTDYINHQNNRNFTSDDFDFGVPKDIEKGLTQLPIALKGNPFIEGNKLTYRRMDVSKLVKHKRIILNLTEVSNEEIVNALLEQYSIYLDEDTYVLDEVDEEGNLYDFNNESTTDPSDPSGGDGADKEGDVGGIQAEYIENQCMAWTDSEGNIHLQIKHTGMATSLKIHHSYDKYHMTPQLLPWFTIYPEEDVWGDDDSATQAQSMGVIASYEVNEGVGQWSLMIERSGVVGALIEDTGSPMVFYPRLISIPGEYGSELTIELTDEPVDEEVLPDLSSRYFKLTMLNEHLLLQGSIIIRCMPTLFFDSASIGQLLDIRRYFSSKGCERFPIEQYLNTKVVKGTDEDGYLLFNTDIDNIDYSVISRVLTYNTYDDWVVENKISPFNVNGIELLYNGLASTEYPSPDRTYPYVMVLELSDEYCLNLKGKIVIAYRNEYKRKSHWVSGRYVRPIPIFTRK